MTCSGLSVISGMYGDIVKIIVTPQNEEDIIESIAFTHAVKKPVCTGVMGRSSGMPVPSFPCLVQNLSIVIPGTGLQKGSIRCRNLFPW